MREPAPAPSREEKEAAVSAVLESRTFARSDQLKSFLRYVSELDIAGRAADIKEYVIDQIVVKAAANATPPLSSAYEARHVLP